MSAPEPHALLRNRAPCANCKASKRKCDRAKSRACSRCRKHNTVCVPSITARWRVESIDSTRQRLRQSQRATLSEGEGSEGLLPAAADVIVHAPPQTSPPLPDDGTSTTPPPTTAFADFDLGETSVPSPYPAIDELFLADLDTMTHHGSMSCGSPLSPALAPPPHAELYPALHSSSLTPAPCIAPGPVSYLWQEFVQSIAPGISLEEQGNQNKLTLYFTSRVAGEPLLFSAIIFLSHAVRVNWITEATPHVDPTVMAAVAVMMEQEAVAYVREAMSQQLQAVPRSPSHWLTTLTILIALCSAYIAQGNVLKLWTYLQHATHIAEKGFTTSLATDESFLFLVRWLGYIHIVAMLDETDYSIDAPNYFGIAAQEDHGPDPSNPDAIFSDVDPFLGVSHTVGDLLYRLGRLIRSRRGSATLDTVRTDATDVEVRLQVMLRKLTKYKQDGGEISSHLDQYNEALVHTAALLFFLEIKRESPQSTLVQSTIAQVLDACAAVPEDSRVAKLMLLPLYSAGARTTRPVYKDFVHRRLRKLKSGYCFSNVGCLIDIIEQRWLELKTGRNSQGERRASVCVLL